MRGSLGCVLERALASDQLERGSVGDVESDMVDGDRVASFLGQVGEQQSGAGEVSTADLDCVPRAIADDVMACVVISRGRADICRRDVSRLETALAQPGGDPRGSFADFADRVRDVLGVRADAHVRHQQICGCGCLALARHGDSRALRGLSGHDRQSDMRSVTSGAISSAPNRVPQWASERASTC